MTLVLGIDPGASGALAAYGDGILHIEDMPTFDMVVNKSVRKRLDPLALSAKLEMFKLMGVELAVLEAVGGRPKQSASNAFVFGYGVGMIVMGLIQQKIPFETVEPGVWKKAMKIPGKGGKKATAAERKQAEGAIKHRCSAELFPEHREKFYGPQGGARMDRMEAAAMALFGHRHMLNAVRPDGEARILY